VKLADATVGRMPRSIKPIPDARCKTAIIASAELVERGAAALVSR